MRKLLFPLLFTFISGFVFADHFEVDEVPSWVKRIEVPKTSKVAKYDVVGGFYSALFDEQRNLIERAVYTHAGFKVLSSAGVQGVSEVSIQYDTAYKHVHFHYLYVWRNGKKIDRTKDLTFEFLRNEGGLGMKMYTGKVTAYDILEDIRKGDIVEYAYTIFGENPIFDGKQYDFLPLERGNPVDLLSYRILHDKSQKFYTKCSDCNDVARNEYDSENAHIIELSRENLKTTDFEESVPPWQITYTYFALTSEKTWQDVDQWAQTVFELDSTPEVGSLADDICESHKKLEDQINEAINYVQDEIRYMGLENGIGSIKPFPPSKVLSQRFGDCKDKSLLLATLLNKLGIEQAYPALVNTGFARGIKQMLPGGQAFDHCILYFNYEGNDYWIDPTISLQGGSFEKMCVPDFGVALVVGDDSGDLMDMNVKDTITRVEIMEEFTFADFEKPGFLTVETKHYGLVADNMRGVLDYISRKELSDELRQRYGRVFSGIQKDELVEIEDDEENNIITTTETYFLVNPWKYQDYEGYTATQFRYEPLELYNYIGQSECEKKKHPVYIPFPAKISQTTVLNLPEKLPLEDSKKRYDNAAFTYIHRITPIKPKVVLMNYDFYTKSDEVSPTQFAHVCLDMNEISSEISLTLTYSKPKIDSEKFRKALKEWKPGYLRD